jgi:SAM-dependent methyltransferase
LAARLNLCAKPALSGVPKFDQGEYLHRLGAHSSYYPFLDETAGLSKELSFSDVSFDTVLMTIQEIARILRSNGKLILGIPLFYWLHEVPHDYYSYTEFALQRFGKISGLRTVELWPYGGLPEILIDLTSKALYRMPRWVEVCLRPLHSALASHGPTF